jgi:imidazolonepropionase-like amidohydrolase
MQTAARAALAALACALALPPTVAAQERPVAIRGARILPIAGPPIDRGVLVVQGGRITAIGAEGVVAIPEGAEVVDAAGKVVLPGLVDTHSHIGDGDGGDRSNPIQGEVRILDAIDPRSDDFRKALAGGVTTVNVMPGSGHLMSGQTAYLKLRRGRVITDLLYCRDVLTDICGGLKMANGTNPRGEAPWPGTRAKAAALVRERFIQAREYREKLRAAGADSTKRPARDLELEAMVEALEGRRVVHHHTHRHDDILTVLRLQQEFGFRLVLQHVSEGWKVAREIAAAGVPASVIVIDAPGGKLEAVDLSLRTGAILDEAGVLVGFHTDDGITDSRFFLRSAALAVRGGMDRDRALRALTLAGARMLDLQDRVGSLEPGKDADFVILSGDPLALATRVEQTWVEGRKVFDLASSEDRPFAVGGWRAVRESPFDHHDGMEGH